MANLGDLALDPLDARGFGESAKVFAVEPGIEMISVIGAELLRPLKATGQSRLLLEAIVADVAPEPELLRVKPEMLKIDEPSRMAESPKRVEIAVALGAPVFE